MVRSKPTIDTSVVHYEPDYTSPMSASTQVSHDDALETPSTSEGEDDEYALAMHDFIPKAPNATCLSFRAGQVIHVLNRHETGWWDGELDGRRGWFPSNYVSAHNSRDQGHSSPVQTKRHTPRADRPTSSSARTVTRTPASPSASSASSASSRASSNVGPDTPPDLSIESCPPLMEPILHALSLLSSAVRANRISHFQPSTACVISCVRSVLSATDCLARESPHLKLHPSLAYERKHILAELAKLVAQSRKASTELAVEVDEDALRYRAQDAMDMVRMGASVFIAVKRFLGKAVDCGIKLPRRRINAQATSITDQRPDQESRSSVGTSRHSASTDLHYANPAIGLISTQTSPTGARRRPSSRTERASTQSRQSPSSHSSLSSTAAAAGRVRSMVDLRAQRRVDELRIQSRVAQESMDRKERPVKTFEGRRALRVLPDVFAQQPQEDDESFAESTDSSSTPLVNGPSATRTKRERYMTRGAYPSASSLHKTAPLVPSHRRATASLSSSISSTISLSSISSSSFYGSPFDGDCSIGRSRSRLPTHPLTSGELFSTLRSTHDGLLSIIAAFIGHVHSHSRTAHPSSKGTLIALTRDVVERVRELITVVEGVTKFCTSIASHTGIIDNESSVSAQAFPRAQGREVLALMAAQEALYSVTNVLVDTVRKLTTPEGTELDQDVEERSRLATLQAATAALRAGGDCVSSVKLCLSKRLSEMEGARITLAPLQDLPVASPSAINPVFTRSSRSASISISPNVGPVQNNAITSLDTDLAPETVAKPRNTLSYLGRKANSLSALHAQYAKDAHRVQPSHSPRLTGVDSENEHPGEEEDITVQPPPRSSPSAHDDHNLVPLSPTHKNTVFPTSGLHSASMTRDLASGGSGNTDTTYSLTTSPFSFQDGNGGLEDDCNSDGGDTDTTSVSGSASPDMDKSPVVANRSALLPVQEHESSRIPAVSLVVDEETHRLLNGKEEHLLAHNSIDLQAMQRNIGLHSVSTHSVPLHSEERGFGSTIQQPEGPTSIHDSEVAEPSQSNFSQLRTINTWVGTHQDGRSCENYQETSQGKNGDYSPSDIPPAPPRKSHDENFIRGSLPLGPWISPTLNTTTNRMIPPTSTPPESPDWILSPEYADGDVITNSEGILVGATLPALVEKMTPHNVMRDAHFSSVFFQTFRLFTTPAHFVEALVARYNLPPPAEALQSTENHQLWIQQKLIPIRLRIATVIKMWLEVYWRSSSDDVVLRRLETFVTQMLDGIVAGTVAKIMDLIKGKMHPELLSVKNNKPGTDRLREVALPLTPITSLPFPASPSEIPRPSMNRTLLAALRSKSYATISVLDFDSLELARQLTIMESALFCRVPPEEVLEVGERPTAHVKAISTLSTAITGWVLESILKADLELRKRTALLKFFIKVAQRCVGLNNYSTPRAILAALDSSTISRLSTVWSALPQKNKQQLEDLRKLADHARNYGYYRSRLRQTVPPAVPFMGLFLTDITFIREGNPMLRPSPKAPETLLINYNRYFRLARTVHDMQRLQIPYLLKEIPEVQFYLTQAFDTTKEMGDLQDLYRRSLMVEPRQTQDEIKERKGTDLFGWATRTISQPS